MGWDTKHIENGHDKLSDSESLAPTGCPTIQFHSDADGRELASAHTVEGFGPTGLLTSNASRKWDAQAACTSLQRDYKFGGSHTSPPFKFQNLPEQLTELGKLFTYY